jgi:hypothetical protein
MQGKRGLADTQGGAANLGTNAVDEAGARQLARAVWRNTRLDLINLEGNPGCPPELAADIYTAVKLNTRPGRGPLLAPPRL